MSCGRRDQGSLGRLPGGGGFQQRPGGWVGWRESPSRCGAPDGLGGGSQAGAGWRFGQAGSWQERPGWGAGGAGEAGLGENQPGSQSQPRCPLTCCASRAGSTLFASFLSTPLLPPPPALQDPASNPTCLLWDFWSSSLVCRDLPRPGPRPSGVRAQLAVQGTWGQGVAFHPSPGLRGEGLRMGGWSWRARSSR